ncbi:MAG: hypothetical protein Q9227_005422 [Pyrenula ochraceoflavens]
MEVRREWGSTPEPERAAYIEALKCLWNKPSQMDRSKYPGALNRYLDFTVVHIERTLHIHIDALFLSWHRNFIRIMQKTMRDECGYTGSMPYWDWAKWADDPASSPIFDGGPYSLGADGEYLDDGPLILGPNLTLPHGGGGGCLKPGHFDDWISTMGPYDVNIIFDGTGELRPGMFTNLSTTKCLQRDVNAAVAQTYTNQILVDEDLATINVGDFQTLMNGAPGTSNVGLHAGGHFTIGKIGSDFFASPQDPAFWVHHGNVDRLWAQWQAADPENRQYAVSGTSTVLNIPPSPNVTLDYVETFLGLDDDMVIRDLMSITDGPFCYRYE